VGVKDASKPGNARLSLTLRLVRVTTSVVGKKYYIYYVSAGLVIQHAKRLRRIILTVAPSGSTPPHIISQTARFRKKYSK